MTSEEIIASLHEAAESYGKKMSDPMDHSDYSAIDGLVPDLVELFLNPDIDPREIIKALEFVLEEGERGASLVVAIVDSYEWPPAGEEGEERWAYLMHSDVLAEGLIHGEELEELRLEFPLPEYPIKNN